jgi:DNA repair protein RadC
MSEARPVVYRTIRDLAADERPRERLARHGPEVLSDAELVAIVLGSGLSGTNVLDLSRSLLTDVGGLPGLLRADVAALRRVRGLGPAKATQLAAAVELGRRAGQLDTGSRPLLTSPEAVYGYIGSRFIGKTREEAYVLPLDSRGRLLGTGKFVPGGVNHVALRAADVFREPILVEATAAILVHNHPSGDPLPSPQDIAVTKLMIETGVIMGIELEDHMVIGQGSFISMRREGIAFRRR